MLPEAFKFNSQILYPVKCYTYSNTERQKIKDLLLNPTVYINNKNAHFIKKFLNITDKYVLPRVSLDAIISSWESHPMKFWQNQLNFAVWCATTGCGISIHDHLMSSEKMIQSFYLFHVYFQTRKILNQLRCALPSDPSWSAFDNSIDMTTYERFCNEFGVSPSSDFRLKHGDSNGLGTVFAGGYHTLNTSYNPKYHTFTKPLKHVMGLSKVDYIAQGSEANDGFVYFILDKSKGFTRAGVERINESVRAYVWAILGSQGQTMASIIAVGPGFDAQKQFLSNIEDMISHAEDLPKSIKNYQDVLHYARSKVDFVLGEAIYMVPSNMELKVGRIENYNNEIIVSTVQMSLGTNQEVNVQKRSSTNDLPQITHEVPKIIEKKNMSSTVSASNHEQNKNILLVGAFGIGLGYYFLY